MDGHKYKLIQKERDTKKENNMNDFWTNKGINKYREKNYRQRGRYR